MILDILKDGLEYVKNNSNNIIIYYLGILMFPIVLVESYSYHIIENCLNGIINNNDRLSDITINVETFINGLKMLVLKITYYLPEIIIAILAVNKIIDMSTAALTIILLSFISYYISQIACISMVESKSLTEGYNFSKIFDILKTVGLTYVKLIVTTFIILLGIFAVTVIFTGILTFMASMSTTLSLLLIILLPILYFIFIILIIPLYVLFKNRTIVSIYNLS